MDLQSLILKNIFTEYIKKSIVFSNIFLFSFFSAADSVSKFFRQKPKEPSQESPSRVAISDKEPASFFRPNFFKSGSLPNTPRSQPNKEQLTESFVSHPEDDCLSMESIGSQISSVSQMSAFSSLDLTDRSGSHLQLSFANNPTTNDSINDHSEPITIIEPPNQPTNTEDISTETNIPIGTPLDQSLVQYTARLVASRFVLTGCPGRVVGNDVVRVSIKNLALLVLAGCIRLDPEALVMPLAKQHSTKSEGNLLDIEDNKSICIIDNHFGRDSSESEPSCINQDKVDLSHVSSPEETMKTPLSVGIVSEGSTGFTQRIYDVLLLFAESDPMLRGNCISIAESFVSSVFNVTPDRDVDEFVKRKLGSEIQSMPILSLNGLIALILEVHLKY